ncbi:MAG: GNAT family N-acetyltransferase [Acidobacteriota bacterium]|nr:GNAT family N-acetyltransferase [Acidobacteriota bacterium]
MTMVRAYTPQHAAVWDELVDASVNGTFLHSRKFLAYHGDRFQDRSLLIYDARENLCAVLPAALDPTDPQTVVSHPGATYGGLIHAGNLTGNAFAESFDAVLKHYRRAGLQELCYKAVPHIYHRVPAMEDLYHLFRRDAVCYRRDLSACVDLQNRLPLHQMRRRGIRKAGRSDIDIAENIDRLPRFWHILGENLAERHGAKPVHSLEEIQGLIQSFPRQMELACAVFEGDVVAGCLLFKTPVTTHCQYIASTAEGRSGRALDLLFETLIRREQMAGKRYFNFGISTENQGRDLNDGLHRFKNGFGGGTITHEFFRLEL